ncbi:MAG TPA: hypothetical protein VFP65_10205, partial [Anaeromyxobacteraceae bacterium]|nr:hypothetical protein [Anaeromyxobacteraceae bacterium]
MRSRRALLAAALAVLALAIAAGLLLRGASGDRGAATSAPSSFGFDGRSAAEPSRPRLWPPEGGQKSTPPSNSFPSDGALEVLVTAAGAPLPGAEVRLYRRL